MATVITFKIKTDHIARLVILLLVVNSTDLSAQSAVSLSVGAQHRAMEMGLFGGPYNGRLGITARLGLMGDAGGIRMVVGHGSQGDVAPGWSIAMVEIEGRFTLAGPVRMGGRLAAGGLGVDNSLFEANVRECAALHGRCSFGREPLFIQEKGWAYGGEAGLVAGVRLSRRFDIGLTYGVAHLRGGANAGRNQRVFGFGIEYLHR